MPEPMDRIRALIVDDEPIAREGIRLLLEAYADVEVVGEAGDGRRAALAIQSLDPDLVFLDVEMPELNGFDVIEAIGTDAMPAVIFVTAYDAFALRAFDAHALDYLLKPLEPERFDRALARARIHLRGAERHALERRLEALLHDVRDTGGYLERFVVQRGERFHIVPVADVDWLEAARNYVKLHAGRETFVTRSTLSSIEERLDPDAFMRVHRSILVRRARIEQVEPLHQGSYLLILSDGTRLHTGRSYRDAILDFLAGGGGE